MLQNNQNALEFRNVTFSRNHRPLVSNLNFTICQGAALDLIMRLELQQEFRHLQQE